MIYITGDTHGQFDHIVDFCEANKLTDNDKLIILGDVGVNYYCNWKDKLKKIILSDLEPTFICVHGNHEERPENIPSYNNCGKFYYEPEYPNILFCIDGEKYEIEGKSFLCLGGAYSVDKYYRLRMGYRWFKSEQMSEDIKNTIRNNVFGHKFNYVLSHTCPYKYIPREMFLPQVNQSTVDSSMEKFLNECEENIEYGKWFCGHWHCNKKVNKV